MKWFLIILLLVIPVAICEIFQRIAEVAKHPFHVARHLYRDVSVGSM